MNDSAAILHEQQSTVLIVTNINTALPGNVLSSRNIILNTSLNSHRTFSFLYFELIINTNNKYVTLDYMRRISQSEK